MEAVPSESLAPTQLKATRREWGCPPSTSSLARIASEIHSSRMMQVGIPEKCFSKPGVRLGIPGTFVAIGTPYPFLTPSHRLDDSFPPGSFIEGAFS